MFSTDRGEANEMEKYVWWNEVWQMKGREQGIRDTEDQGRGTW